MAIAEIINNLYLWIGLTLLFFLTSMMFFAVLIFLKMKTHAITELKAFLKKQPIALFFQDNRYCEWKVVKVDAGIIEDKKYGSFIINEKGSYIDRATNAVLLPFDANVATSLNIKACKVSDDLRLLATDEKQLSALRQAIAENQIDDSYVNAIKSSVNIGSIKTMLNAMLPHNITAKVNMMVAQKLSGMNKVNYWETVMIFVAILGAIVMGYILVKQVGG